MKVSSNIHNDEIISVVFGLTTLSTFTYFEQKFASVKIMHFCDFTNSSLGISVIVQGRNSITGCNHNCDTGNFTDKTVSKYRKFNVELI